MINEKPQLINEYESGKAIPNPQVRCEQQLKQAAKCSKGGGGVQLAGV
jgi:ribosome-binding protein aMBF1 (putative translation factor)